MDTLDAISVGRKNSKARVLIASSEEMLNSIDAKMQECDELFGADVKEYSLLRQDVLEDTLHTFDETYLLVRNADFTGSTVTYRGDTYEDINDEFCKCKHDIEPVVVEQVKSGAFGAVSGGLLAGVLTFSAAVFAGAMQTGQKIDFEKVPTQEQINTLLQWFGGGILNQGTGDVLTGSYVLGGGVAFVTLLVGYLMLNARSKKNLTAAEATFSAATSAHQEISTQNRKTMGITEYLENMQKKLATLKVYMDEYNAILKRIIHIEGTDFTAYATKSQTDLKTALSIYKRIKSLITSKVVAKDGIISSGSKYEIEKSEKFLVDLAEKVR